MTSMTAHYVVVGTKTGRELAESWRDGYGWKQQRVWREQDLRGRWEFETRREAEEWAEALLASGWNRAELIVPPER